METCGLAASRPYRKIIISSEDNCNGLSYSPLSGRPHQSFRHSGSPPRKPLLRSEIPQPQLRTHTGSTLSSHHPAHLQHPRAFCSATAGVNGRLPRVLSSVRTPPRRTCLHRCWASADTRLTDNSSQTSPPPRPPLRLPSVYQTLKFVLGIVLAGLLVQAVLNLLVSASLAVLPPVLTYLSMALVFWPWPAAVGLGAMALVLAGSQAGRKSNSREESESGASSSAKPRPVESLLRQILILSGALTWLILVPCGHFMGYLGAWPLFLFFVYVLFFAESAFIRCWLYGDLASRTSDKQWATPVSRLAQVSFIIALVAGHWFAAKESPLLAMAITGTPSGSNLPALTLLFFALWLHWDATLVLGKFFDRLVPPELVVITGPYRWVRHPIYTSYMLLFCGFCSALRSYRSLAFLLTTCLAYYSHRTQLEEEQLIDHLGDEYSEYRSRVDKKFLPFLF